MLNVRVTGQTGSGEQSAPKFIESNGPSPFATRNRTLMFVAPNGAISNALQAAIECEFRFLRVHLATDIQDACSAAVANIDLILVDRSFIGELVAPNELSSWHNGTPIAVFGEIGQEQDTRLFNLVGTRQIRGFLPTNSSLDILLSIIRILLNGGEYVPSALLRWQFAEPVAQVGKMQRDGVMSELTAREWQILGHVAKGSQNKIIANDLGLSEHTVKIHIHNIINKLGVHNRTEAAAIYFARQNGSNSNGSNGTQTGGNSGDMRTEPRN